MTGTLNFHASDAQRQIARYRSLVQVTAALARLVRTDDLLRAMHEQVRLMFDTPITLLARRAPGGGWHCLTLEGDNVSEQRIPPRPDGLLERVLRGTIRLENDLPTYLERERLGVARLHFRSDLPHTLSWMGVPLHAGEVTGVLSVQSYVLNAFTPEDLEFLELLAVHLSIALENAALHERVDQEAHTDPLTGLWNRRRFTQRGEAALNAAQSGGERFTLAIMDLQDFKAINDRFGHAVGDEVLTGVGTLLRRLAGRGAHVFRLGGDEFAVLLPGDRDGARLTLLEWLEDVRAHPWTTAAPPHLNIGLAQAHPSYSMSDWIREADSQMYEAKRRRLHLIETG